MTLIIGILCADGAVLGADGMATFGAMGQRTIQQPTRKLTKIGPCVAIGTSGPVGLGQRFTASIEELWNVAASGSCTFTVTFTPGAIGSRSATLSVSYTSGDGASPQTSSLSGTGTTSSSVTHKKVGNIKSIGNVVIE
jgi:Proteasome subunit